MPVWTGVTFATDVTLTAQVVANNSLASSNATVTRNCNTTYQNTGPGPLAVAVTATPTANSTMYLQLGATSANANGASGGSNVAAQFCLTSVPSAFQFIVPAGQYYAIYANTAYSVLNMTYWTELA